MKIVKKEANNQCGKQFKKNTCYDTAIIHT